MPVDDELTRALILSALSGPNRRTARGTTSDDAFDAFCSLHDRRNDPADAAAAADENLAAAEHYWISYYLVSSGQVPANTMHSAIEAYATMKEHLPDEWMRSDPSRPTTPPSPGQRRWAHRGVSAGETERRRTNRAVTRHGLPPTNFGVGRWLEGVRARYGL